MTKSSKLYVQLFLAAILQVGMAFPISSQELPAHVIEAYQEDGWFYFGDNTFLYRDRYNTTGDPEVLSLSINPSDPYAMLYLNRFDCENQRVMVIAYKRYQNKPLIEREHYLFENKLEWQYPIKTSLFDRMLKAVCVKFGK